MPDVREKLVELLDHVQDYGMKRVKDESSILLVHKTNEMVADHLIANGVTIQRWIPVAERLPEPETDVLTFCFGNIDILTYRYNRRGNLCFMFRDDCGYWKETFAEVSHWMPLPEEPKEVE